MLRSSDEVTDFIELLKLSAYYKASTKIQEKHVWIIAQIEEAVRIRELFELFLINFTSIESGKQRLFKQLNGNYYDRETGKEDTIENTLERILKEHYEKENT